MDVDRIVFVGKLICSKRQIKPFCLSFWMLFLTIFHSLHAQDHILASSVHGSSANDYVTDYIVINDDLFVIGRTTGADFPTTNGSTTIGSFDYFFLRYDSLMNIVESRLIGGSGSDTPWEIKTDGSYIYVFGVVTASGMPATIGNGYAGITDVHVLKLDFNGNFLGGTYLGGSKFEFLNDVKILNGKAHLVINSSSSDFPVTGGSTNNGGDDIVYAQVDLTNLSLDYAAYIGGHDLEFGAGLDIDNSTVYIGFTTRSTDLSTTDGSIYAGGSFDIAMTALNINSGNVIATTYIGGAKEDEFMDIVAVGGQIFIQGSSNSTDFTITNGSSPQGNDNVVFAHYDSNLSLQTSAYLLGANVFDKNLEYHNGFLYMTAYTGGNNVNLIKVDLNGNVIWNYKGITNLDDLCDVRIYNDKVHIVTSVYDPFLVSTNGSYLYGQEDFYYAILSLNGTLEFASYYGGVKRDGLNFILSKDWLQLSGSKVWLSGHSEDCFPITNNSTHSGARDLPVILIETCPTSFAGNTQPSSQSQTICKNGFASEIQVDPFIISGADLPSIKTCGIPIIQSNLEANYQWQSAPGTAGPWTNIPGAIQANHTPQPLSVFTCFRRLAIENACCGSGVLQTSGTHCITIGPNEAPNVDAGGVYTTCPGIPVIMKATVSAGTPPYQIKWAAGNSNTVLGTTVEQIVTPTVAGSTIYTITVSDANGCMQIDQSIINTYAADAGPDVSFCEGQPGKTIGGTAIPGLTGVTYKWSPAIGLSCTNCPNPTASPSVISDYILTLTIPVTNSGSCTTTDTVTVSLVNSPTQRFAGPDRTVCFGDTAHIGIPAISGFSYNWSPGSYLSNNTASQTIFDHGTVSFPDPNPTIKSLVAFKQGCYWYDQMEIAVIRAGIGADTLCGPKFIGLGDPTNMINESWQWTQLAGDGMILGPTNTPMTSVSSSTGITSVYELAVSNNGTTCRDTAVVPPCVGDGSGAICKVQVISTVGCPSKQVYPDVCLEASAAAGPPGPYTYSWSPQIGLDTFAGALVCLTDSIPRTYTVTLTNILDTSIVCSGTIYVNDPAWSKPVFSVPDLFSCPYDSVQIGQPPVNGYSYTWTPQHSLDDPLISNPVAAVSSTTDYWAIVTDTISGCTIIDTTRITISGTPAKAGPDKLICNAGVLTLGYPQQPNTLYSWTPANANWQNGTDQFSAQPQVLTAINTTFVLTTTDTISGCVDTDTVEVSTGNPIFQFVLPNMTYCPSQPSLSLGSGVPGGGNWVYSWSPTVHMDDPTIPTPTITPPPANGITYTLVITNPSGCSYQTTQIISPILQSPIVGPSQSLCVGETTSIGSNLNPVGQGIVYSWFPTTNLSSSSSPFPTFSASIPGNYVYTLTVNKDGCINSATVTIVVNEFLIDIEPKTACEGTCINIGVPAVQGATYNWSPAMGLDDPTSSNPLACVTTSAVYTLVAIGPSGCQSTTQVPIYTNSNPAPLVTIDTLGVCLGSQGNFLSPVVTPNGTYSYNWAPNNGTLLYSNASSPEVFLNAPGTYMYQVTVTNEDSGCATESSATVIAAACDSSLTCNLTVSFDPSYSCDETLLGTATAIVNGGFQPYSYSWSNGENTSTISQLPVGTFSTTITDAAGCSATGNVTIVKPPKMNLIVSVSNVSCDSGSDGQISVLANGGVPDYTYQWETGHTTSSITGLSVDTFSLSVTDSRSCQSDLTLILGMEDCCPSNLCAEAIMGNLSICNEISIDPNHPITTLDCDGDGVSNVDECNDGTDPLDHCAYEGTSISLPVTADQSDCPAPCSDLSPIMTILPGNVAGISVVEMAVEVKEVEGVNTIGSIIMVRIPSDPRLQFVWDIGLTLAALVPVQNADWNYLGDNGIVHNWTYNGPGLTVPANGKIAFGFQSFYDPQATDGQTTFTATIIPFSGGECNILNNTDSERLVYFK